MNIIGASDQVDCYMASPLHAYYKNIIPRFCDMHDTHGRYHRNTTIPGYNNNMKIMT